MTMRYLRLGVPATRMAGSALAAGRDAPTMIGHACSFRSAGFLHSWPTLAQRPSQDLVGLVELVDDV
jgi:hypothetical protein